jgi:hypothetical protein
LQQLVCWLRGSPQFWFPKDRAIFNNRKSCRALKEKLLGETNPPLNWETVRALAIEIRGGFVGEVDSTLITPSPSLGIGFRPRAKLLCGIEMPVPLSRRIRVTVALAKPTSQRVGFAACLARVLAKSKNRATAMTANDDVRI